MKRALIHHSNTKFCEALAQALGGYFPACQCVVSSTKEAFTAALAGPEPFQAVVLESGGEVAALPEAISQGGTPPFLLVLGSRALISGIPAGAQVAELSGDATLSALFAALDAHLKENLRPEYMGMPLGTLLLHGSRQHFDIFVKLSDDKFVKVLGKEEVFDTNQYMRFLNKKVSTLFLPHRQFLGLYDKIQEDLVLAAMDPGSLSETIELNQGAVSAIHSLFAGTGMNQRVEKMINVSVKSSVMVMARNPKLSDLLSKITKDTSSHLSWHCTALSYLSCNLAAMLDWKSEATYNKLALASLLHDITLDDDEQAKIESRADLKTAGLAPAVLDKLLRHPLEAAKAVAGIKDVPGEVAFIVEQHHELPDGKGYPKGLQEKDISPIAALFIIAHDMVDELYKNPDNFDLEAFFKKRDEEHRYAKGGFGTVFRGIMGNLKTLNRLG